MHLQQILDELESASFDVLAISSVAELPPMSERKSFELILLGLPIIDLVRVLDQIEEAYSDTNSMIVGLIDESDPDLTLLNDSDVMRKLDDCLSISGSPAVLKRRLAFLSDRATIRKNHEETVSRRSLELRRINSELTDAIEEQWEAQSALRESEAMVRAIVETTVDGIITIDTSGVIETFNRAAEEIFGYTLDEVKGRNISMLMPNHIGKHHDGYIHAYLETGVAKIIGIGREVHGRRKNGSVFPLELSISELIIGSRTLFTGVIRDITERRRLEREILRAGDQERQRIGHDLHDGLGQALTGIGLISKSLADRVRLENAEQAAEIDDVTQMVRDADQLARVIARNLVPVDVESNGLSYALHRLASNAEKLFDIRCTFSDPAETLVQDNSLATHLYRIAQEALSNAVRHGKATRVDLKLESEPAFLTLVIADNGSGLSEKPNHKPTGMGLRIMQYRSGIIRSAFSIATNEAGGATIRCRVPSEVLNMSRTTS